MISMQFTQTSMHEYATLSSGVLTPTMAAEYLLEEKLRLRTFREMLFSMVLEQDAAQRLFVAFTRDDPQLNPDSVRRKIRNWLSGSNVPGNREDIFHIGFALSLSEGQIDQLLGFATDAGIHYRNGRDVVFTWFLRHNGTWAQACAFYDALPPVPNLSAVPKGDPACVTRELHLASHNIQTAEELRTFYLANLQQFGLLHLRSYTYFEKYMSLLMRPESPASREEPNYSIETIMSLYMSLHMPSGRDRSVYSAVQKLIKSNWPNATMLKNIMGHRIDVPRKLLLLLYVITENSSAEDGYCEADEDYLTIQDRLEDHICMLNAILSDCGLPLMDPRNAYDWVVLYALTANEQSMSEQMEKVIEVLYADM